MEWEQLTLHIREIKETFDKSDKYVSQNRVIQKEQLTNMRKFLSIISMKQEY